MLHSATLAVVLGATLISAAPATPASSGPVPSLVAYLLSSVDGSGAKDAHIPSGGNYAPHSYTPTASAASAGQTQFSFPLPDGFPTVSASGLLDIEKAAHGTLPDGPLPATLSATTTTVLELIAFNEIFEVAFFTSLLNNVTNNVEGYKIENPVLRDHLIRTLTAVQAQEKLHYLGANGILSNAGKVPIQPCKYVFPVDNVVDAVRLAATFTDVVLGTLQDAQSAFATDGDSELVPLIGSVIGQEGEQDGYYRGLLSLIPSAAPFLTRSVGPFAYSALNQAFVVNGSCPNANIIQIPIFAPLTVVTQNIQLADQTLTFSVKSASVATASWHVVYVNQQNVPVVEPISNVVASSGGYTFTAEFPAAKYLMDGLTIAAVTNSAGPFASVGDVAAGTVFAPGLIEIN